MSKNRAKLELIGESTEAHVQVGKKFSVHNLVSFTPKTTPQKQFFSSYQNEIPVIVQLGSAGTGKTVCALWAALYDVLSSETMPEKIVIFRNCVPEHDQGFLPGPQPYSTKVLTPTGWRNMSDIEPGDYVIAHTGESVRVIDTFEKGDKDIYEIKTIEGKTTKACGDHLWLTRTHENLKRCKDGSVKTTLEISDTLKTMKFIGGGDQREIYNHILPRSNPVNFDNSSNNITISPYMLGYMLGDGNFQGTPSICVHEKDSDDLLEKLHDEMVNYPIDGIEINSTKTSNDMYSLYFKTNGVNKRGYLIEVKDVNGVRTYHTSSGASKDLGIPLTTLRQYCLNESIKDGVTYSYKNPEIGDRYKNNLNNALDILGLYGKVKGEKHIPDNYMYGTTVDQRVSLLQGLMDSDGSCSRTGNAVFYNSSKLLVDDVVELVRSLGGRATYKERELRIPREYKGREIKSNSCGYEIQVVLPDGFNPFSFKRKAERYRSIKKTHDRICSVKYTGIEKAKCILIDHPDHLYITDDYIVTHNTIEEKNEPFEAPYEALFDEILEFKSNNYNNLKAKNVVEFRNASYNRGTTLYNSVIVIDEAQNMTYQQLRTVITRAGHGSRIVICADYKQNDLAYMRGPDSGLKNIVEVLNNMPSEDIDFVTYTADDVIRGGIVGRFLKAEDSTCTSR